MIFLTTLGIVSRQKSNGVAPATDTVAIANFSRDKTMFDSGFVFGRSAATVAISGTGTIGQMVQVRAYTLDDGGAGSTAWTDAMTIDAGGNWTAVLTAPRAASWYRAEVRLKATPTINAATVNRFGVGHVIALWGQSEVDRIVSTFYDGTTAPTLVDEDAVQVIIGATASPTRSFVTNAAPYTAGVAALAQVLTTVRPAEKFAVIFHSVPGTDPRELVDDANLGRSWAADKALHDFACADGQKVGIAAMSWFAAPRSLAASYGEAMFPLFTGKTLAGATVTFPATVTYGSGSTYHADHWFGELYDYNYTKWVPYGPHRFDISQDMQDATHFTGGGAEAALSAIQSCRTSWRAMVANPLATMFLPLGIEPVTYLNGHTDGAGGWTDTPHPAGDDVGGTQQWARLTAHAVLRSAGMESFAIPAFDNCLWEPTGAWVEVWSSSGAITTTRLKRAEAALPGTYPHWTTVMGFQINGAPAQNAQIVGGRVRIYRNGGGNFVYSDIIQYGEGGATGMLKTPYDYSQQVWKNLPIVDVGAALLDGIPLRPLPNAGVFANTLPAATPTFTVGTTGPRFLDPLAIGSVPRLTVIFEGSFDTPAVSSQPLVPTGGNLTLTILNTRKLRVYFKDSANTIFVNSVSLANALPTGAIRLVTSVDLTAGYLRIWINGVQEGAFTIGANSGLIATSVRQISLLATNTGTSQATGVFTRIAVWKDATATGVDPASTAYKVLLGPAATVNADGWKLGSNAT